MLKLMLLAMCAGFCLSRILPVIECQERLVNCFVEPCLFASCTNHPNAECRDNYCGGCFADFYEEVKRCNYQSDLPFTVYRMPLETAQKIVVVCFAAEKSSMCAGKYSAIDNPIPE